MSAWLLSLLERLPSWVRRWLMIVLPLALLGVLVVGFVLAPRWAGPHSKRAASTGLLRSSPTTATQAPTRPAPPVETGQGHVRAGHGQRDRERSHAANRPPIRGSVSERPPAPAPHSAEGMMLAVARRLRDRVHAVPGRPATSVGAHGDRVDVHARVRSLSPRPAGAVDAAAGGAPEGRSETYRVASVEPAGAPDTVSVSYVSRQDSADTGEFLLRLVREHGHWLVAALEA